MTNPYDVRACADRVALSVVTPPIEEPLALDDVREWLGFAEDDDSQDGILSTYIRLARHQVEEDTGLKLLTQTVEQTQDRLAWNLPLQLHVGPVQSVASVKVYSGADVETTVSASDYIVDASRRAPRLLLATGKAWPTDLRLSVAVVVRVVAGWTNTASIPEPLLYAMRLLIQHWHDDCGGETKTEPRMQMAFESLLRPYRLEWL